jgi:sortase A
MEFKFKYLMFGLCVIIIGVAFTAVVFSGKEIKTTHFQKDEISFDYPDTWLITNQTSPSEIVAFTDPQSDLNVTVNRQPVLAGYNPSENFTTNISDQTGMKFISHKKLDFNGTSVDENVYKMDMNGTTVQRTEMWINKNDALYSIIYTTSNFNLDEKSPEIEALTKNFAISNTTVNNTQVWGKVAFPSQGINWNIRGDTVNAMGSVYHYSDSFYPDQNGTVGLLGHHTHYSAPFASINLLNNGDQVIITDYLSQKKYIYQVTKNGDIKGDYKTNPVTFPAGTFELTLVTCYPPGYMSAAYMTHCKLMAVEPI